MKHGLMKCAQNYYIKVG